jgi:O-antigen ligase
MLSCKGGAAMGSEARGRLERIQISAIAATVFILPLIMVPGLTDYNYAKCAIGLIFISGLLVLWGLAAWRRSSWTIRVPWLLIPALAFILAGGLSLIQATNARVVIQSLILLTYFVLLLWMIASVVQDQRDVRVLLGALLASAALAALYGVLQFFGVVAGTPGATGVEAVISSLGNRNHLGGVLLYLFFPAIILLVRAKVYWAKAIILALIAGTFAVLLMLEQVGTRVTFALTSVALLVGWMIFRPIKPLKTNRWWLLGLAGAVAAMCVFTTLQTPIESPGKLWESNSGDVRAWIWLIGAEMYTSHPVTGVGLGNYKIAFFPYKADFATTERGQDFDFPIHRVTQAHNEYIQAGAEFGSIGLFALLCVLGVLATSLWIRLKKSNEKSRLDLLLLTSGILAFLGHSVVSFPAHVASSSLLLIVFCGLALSPRYGKSMTFHWVLEGWRAKGFHLTLVAVSLIVSVFAFNDLRANWLMERGVDQVQAGFYASGEAQLQRSLALDFAPRQTYYYLAAAQIQMGQFEEAEQNLENCMGAYLDARVFLTYADFALKRGRLEDAQTAVDVLLAAHPSAEIECQARYTWAIICIEQRRFDQALTLLTSLSLDYPVFEPGLVALGQLYAVQGMTDLARSRFASALLLIEQKLETAIEELAIATTTERKLIQDGINTLNQQRDHVISQLNDLP